MIGPACGVPITEASLHPERDLPLAEEVAAVSDLHPYPPSIEVLIEQISMLPGIGRRSAERIAYHILAEPRSSAMKLALAIRDVKRNIRACTRCFNVAEDTLCSVCSDAQRDTSLICVVELPRDVIALEKAGGFPGIYHVLQGRLSPAEGVGPESLRIRELQTRLNSRKETASPIRELVLAMNATTEGDATASFLAEEFSASGVAISRLARGLASGTDIESATPSSLRMAFEGRQLLR